MSETTTTTTETVAPNSEEVVTPAHTQKQTITILECYPAHEPRASDPHYKYFNEARRHLERLGKLQCWVNNDDCSVGPIELHHDRIEFSLANGVDITKFEECFPELGVKDDESFLEVIESEGSLLPLCKFHHVGHGGIHVLPYPLWLPQRFWKAGISKPATA